MISVEVVWVPPGRLRCSKGLSEYHQGDCDEYRDNLSTTRETVMSKGTV